MKLTNRENYRVNARQIAEQTWGTGGTHAYRTNRKGAYYYSCSGHGGYVVLATALTEEELAAVKPYADTRSLHLLVVSDQREDGVKFVAGTSYKEFDKYGRGKKRFSVPLGYTYVWEEVEILLFEEDCAWACLEKFTDITHKGRNCTKEQLERIVEGTFKEYYTDRK